MIINYEIIAGINSHGEIIKWLKNFNTASIY